jgi:hypothetical protein
MNNIYQENGYKDRLDYFNQLASEFGVPFGTVQFLGEILGESEDFDGLVCMLEDEISDYFEND